MKQQFRNRDAYALVDIETLTFDIRHGTPFTWDEMQAHGRLPVSSDVCVPDAFILNPERPRRYQGWLPFQVIPDALQVSEGL